MKENSIWKMDKFEAYLRETKSTSEEQIQTLYSEIKAILAHCAQAAEATLDKKTGYFQLLGCDILVDENLKPYLLEINSNPAIFTDITAHKEVIPDVVFKVSIFYFFILLLLIDFGFGHLFESEKRATSGASRRT